MYRLLVADDEIIERKVLLKTLQKNLEGQCELFQAENGREALEIYEKEKIQIAILDIEKRSEKKIKTAVLSFSQPMMNFLMQKRLSQSGPWIIF